VRGRAGGGRPEVRSAAGVGERAARSVDPLLSFDRTPEPPIPDDADPKLLEPSVRAELRSLAKLNAEAVGGHLVAAAQLLDSDPQAALAHARAARRRAARVGVVREAVGIAAYHAQAWAEALTELRTGRRISGDPRTLPMIADCERALGRPQQALRALDDPDVRRLDPETRAELLIVVAGARRDLGQLEAALAVLSRGGLDRARPNAGSTRLWYAYADVLQSLDRRDDAAQWFVAAAARDVLGETDAAERAADLL
jgi:tetratricopeptide (TPR) repeat protein